MAEERVTCSVCGGESGVEVVGLNYDSAAYRLALCEDHITPIKDLLLKAEPLVSRVHGMPAKGLPVTTMAEIEARKRKGK